MTYLSSESASNARKKQYHLGLKPGDLAERILLVGDPDRAQKVASHFSSVRKTQHHREFVTFTGVYKGLEISVLGTGIGEDNTEIAVIECCQITKGPTFIRCGSSGGLKKDLKLGDLAISTAAVRMGATSSFFISDGYPAVAHPDVINALGMACYELDLPFHVGITASAPGFYGAQGRNVPGFPLRNKNLARDLGRMNVMNFEMETATLLTLATLRGVRAGTLCAVYGNRTQKRMLGQKGQEKAESGAIRACLKAFQLISQMDLQSARQKQAFWIPLAPKERR